MNWNNEIKKYFNSLSTSQNCKVTRPLFLRKRLYRNQSVEHVHSNPTDSSAHFQIFPCLLRKGELAMYRWILNKIYFYLQKYLETTTVGSILCKICSQLVCRKIVDCL